MVNNWSTRVHHIYISIPFRTITFVSISCCGNLWMVNNWFTKVHHWNTFYFLPISKVNLDKLCNFMWFETYSIYIYSLLSKSAISPLCCRNSKLSRKERFTQSRQQSPQFKRNVVTNISWDGYKSFSFSREGITKAREMKP